MILLLILLEIKHVLSDYFLQSDWMGISKRSKDNWILGLSAHAGIHGIITFLIISSWTKNIYYGVLAGLFDFITHFIIDRIKSSPNYFGNYYGNNWQSLTLTIIDQGLHHVVLFIIIYINL